MTSNMLVREITRIGVVSVLHIFLDESGDLGFDLSKSGTSRYFVITLLVCEDLQTQNGIISAVKRTLKE